MAASYRPSLEGDLAALAGLDLRELRQVWAGRYGAPPPLRSPGFLRHLLAWRIQCGAEGGLDKQVLKVMTAPVAPKTRASAVREGSRLTREWQGRAYEVEAVEGGFLCDGASYASLSEVARAITGVRWNGPRFFGLRDGAK